LLAEGVPGLAKDVDGEVYFGSDGLEFQANSIYPDLIRENFGDGDS